MSVVGDNINSTVDQVKSICEISKNLNVDIVFGGLGIELLPNMSENIKKTFITYKQLIQLV